MGCVSSKDVIRSCDSPLHDSPRINKYHHRRSSASSSFRKRSRNPNPNNNFGPLEKIKEETEDDDNVSNEEEEGSAGGRSSSRNNAIVGGEYSNSHPNKHSKRAAFRIKFGRLTEGEHVAAGWPAWLSAVAGEAIDGWLPLKSDSFQRLEKIGQGTYSSVYRARNLDSGRMMALKKVRFDNFQPESVRFMAREITILRRLDHPNIMKLEGIITSHLSCSIYFVFEYMEHDLSGLLSCPHIKFTDSQIKCYMRQLLNGIEHCHSRGILHRDIKAANILVNNEGLLKIADFGLANFRNSKQPLTSRVVTLWYRPPELLLGSTNYGTYVDMWSVGCVFAELFIGRPILKGRTEVEQLHKIFKLCGTPPEEYWKTSKLPLAAMFKPQQSYESTLRERCKELPKTSVDLINTFLSVEPYKRGTATSALQSEYFNTKPYACDPSSLPKYPPNKEIDAKFREEARRKKAGRRAQVPGTSRIPKREVDVGHRSNGGSAYLHRSRGSVESHGSLYDTVSEVSQTTTEASQADTICTLPAQPTASNGSFAGASKRRKHVNFSLPTSQNIEEMRSMRQPDSFGSSQVYKPHNLSSDYHEQERFRYSGSMLIQPQRIEGRQESYTPNGVRRSRFYRDADL